MGISSSRRRKARQGCNCSRPSVYACDWKVVCECSLKHWDKSESLKWGFNSLIDYRTDIHSRLKPWSTGGRHLLAKICTYVNNEMCSDDIYFKIPAPSDNKWLVIVEEYFHSVVSLPAWYTLRGVLHRKFNPDSIFSPEISDAQVIGSRDCHVVVQLIRCDWNVDVLLLNTSSEGLFVVDSVFSFKTKDHPYLLEAILSPDYRYMCVKPSWESVLSFSQHPEENNVMLVDLAEERSVLKETLFRREATECVIAFDPRYQWRRIAVGSRQMAGREESVYLYDLEKKIVVCQSQDSQVRQTTHNLVYSPDGRFLASLVIVADQSSWRGFVKVVDFVLVYSSDDLSMLHSLPCMCAPAPINLTSMAFFPLFAEDGRYMCIQQDNVNRDYEWRVKVVTTPMTLSLQHICRLVLRNSLSVDDIKRLHLPTRLKDYIMFRPYLS